MDQTATLRSICEEYLVQVDQLLKNAKPGDGLLGMGKAPQHDACHEAFDQRVEACLASAAGQGPSAAEAFSLAETLLFFEKQREVPPCASWMLVAVQRHCLPLVPFLSAQAAADLQARYSKAYPRQQQLPIQKALLKALRQHM